MTLNLLRQSNIAPAISAWEHFYGPFNFDATPIAPLGSPIIIYSKPSNRSFWGYRGRKGFTIGPALNHYRCFHVVDGVTKALRYSDTVEFLHDYLTQPTVTEGDRIVHALNFLSCAVKDAPATIHHEQLTAISKLRDLFTNWIPRTATMPPPKPSPTVPVPAAPPAKRSQPARSIRDILFKRTKPSFADLHPRIPTTRPHVPPPRVRIDPPRVAPVVQGNEPIAHRTRSVTLIC